MPENLSGNTGILEEEPHFGVLIKNGSGSRCLHSLQSLSKSQLPFWFLFLFSFFRTEKVLLNFMWQYESQNSQNNLAKEVGDSHF